MDEYSDADAEFTKELIRRGEFDDGAYRTYVEKLLALERYILEGPSGWADSMRFGHLKSNYPDEFDILQRELDHEAYDQRRDEEWEQTRAELLRGATAYIRDQQREQDARQQWETVRSND